MGMACRFKFIQGISKEFIESQMAIAITTAECTFGPARVRLGAGYLAAKGKAIIDVSNEVGEHIAQVFTGLMSRHVGEHNFKIEKIKTKD